MPSNFIGTEVEAVGITRPLVVTDKGVADCGVLDKVLEHIPDKMPVAIFDGTPENPTEAAVMQALEAYREKRMRWPNRGWGGSPMDLAKGAILVDHEPPLEQYAAIFGGAAKISDNVAPVIAIPTTAGTGSEVGRGQS